MFITYLLIIVFPFAIIGSYNLRAFAAVEISQTVFHLMRTDWRFSNISTSDRKRQRKYTTSSSREITHVFGYEKLILAIDNLLLLRAATQNIR